MQQRGRLREILLFVFWANDSLTMVFAGKEFDLRCVRNRAPFHCQAQHSTESPQGAVNRAYLPFISLLERGEIGCLLVTDLVQFQIGQLFITPESLQSEAVPKPCLRGWLLKRGLCPGFDSVLAKLLQCRDRFLFTDSDKPLCQRSTVGRFHIASYFVVSLSRGFTDDLSVPHEFVRVEFSSFENGHLSPLFFHFTLPELFFACLRRLRLTDSR